MNKQQQNLEAKALKLYNQITRSVERELGTEYQWGDKLTESAKKRIGPTFLGAFARDAINYQAMKPGDTALVNTWPQGTGGEHWCGVGCDEKDRIIVYDSFGRDGAKLLHIKAVVPVQNTDLDAEQKRSEVNCGPRSVSWCYLFSKNPELAMLI